MMLVMSVIFVVPAMAETDNNSAPAQSAEIEKPGDEINGEAEGEGETEAKTQANIQAGLAEGVMESASVMMRRKGPGEPYEPVEVPVESQEEAIEAAAPVPGNRWGLLLNAEEVNLLARITMLESGGESDLGQQAVVEVILNRVYSPAYPNSVYDVLSQVDCGYRQFSTWKSRNSSSASPSAKVMGNVNAVLEGNTNVLPFETVYFSRKAANKRVQARIGNHVFCNR